MGLWIKSKLEINFITKSGNTEEKQLVVVTY